MFGRRNKVNVLELITELEGGQILIGNRVTDKEWIIEIRQEPEGEFDSLHTAESEKECRRFMERYEMPSKAQGTAAG